MSGTHLVILDWDNTCWRIKRASHMDEHDGMYPDAEEVIRDLHCRGFELVIVSHGSNEIQTGKFSKSNVLKCFKSRIHLVESAQYKLDIFKHLAQQFHWIPPERIVIVGDRIDHEIRYGNQLKFLTVRVRREGKWEKYSLMEPTADVEIADHTVKNLSEFQSLVLQEKLKKRA